MARPLRIEYSGAVYHVTSRGNERKPIVASHIITPVSFGGYLAGYCQTGVSGRKNWVVKGPKCCGVQIKIKDNKNWLKATRHIIEAFFHARYFLEMAVKYGQTLEHPPARLPSGWAAFLYLYNLR